MEKEEAKAKLAAYLDPNLAESERTAKEMVVLGDPAAQAELEGLKSGDDELRASSAPEPPEGYFDAFGKKLDEKIAEEALGAAAGGAAGAGAASIPAAWAAATAVTPQEPDRTSGISSVKDLARHTVQKMAVPEPVQTASELSGMTRRSSVVGMKVAVPPPEAAPKPSWFPMVIGGAAVLVIAVGVMGYKLMGKSDAPSVQVIAMNTPPVAPAAAPAPPPEPVAASPAVVGGAAAPTAAGAAAPGGAAPTAEAPKPEGEAKTHASGKKAPGAVASAGSGTRLASAKGGAASAGSADKAAPAEVERPKKSSGNELDDLLDGATKSASKPKLEDDEAPAKKAKADEPAEGTAEVGINDLRKSLEALQPKMRSCFKRFQIAGTAEVAVVIAPTGKLTSSSLKGDFVGTPTGDCVIAQVKTASFPKFKGSPMSITFPFNLH